VSTDDGEGAVDEQAGLGSDQQDVVQLQVAAAVVLELSYLQTGRHAKDYVQKGAQIEMKKSTFWRHGVIDRLTLFVLQPKSASDWYTGILEKNKIK